MSRHERLVQHHKRQIDRAIRLAYARLATDASAAAMFTELLHCARDRAPRLLDAPIEDGHHPGVDALLHLARFGNAHIRPAEAWPGTESPWRLAVSSLAQHLVGSYEIPLFLASSWHATDSAADDKRSWFVAHSRGARFRSLVLPIIMTRKMEHIFLASQDHMGIEHALRRAELLALGASDELVHAVLSARMVADLRHGEFWRTVWIFLITHAGSLSLEQIGPLIDFLQAIRHDRTTLQTADGMVEVGPPQPTFSIKGRTVESIRHLMRNWHRSLGTGSPASAWSPSPWQPLMVEEPAQDASDEPRRWQLMELTNSAQLRMEGAALHHCVLSYTDRCRRGLSRIWSLRCLRGEKLHRVLTIEVDPARRAIVQARGMANRPASGKPLTLLHSWAQRERLQMAL